MAATTSSATPRTEPFPRLESAPRTPVPLPATSLPSFAARRDSPQPVSFRAELPVNTVSRAALSPKPYAHTLSPRSSPAPLTGAAAMADNRRRRQQKAQEDSRQTSPNPQATALSALMGSTGMSRASDAPSPSRISEPLQRVADKINLPIISETPPDREQRYATSYFGSSDTNGAPDAMTATASGDDGQQQFVDEPDSMTPNHSNNGDDAHLESPEEESSTRPFTYPGPIHSRDKSAPSRGMSLPGAGLDQSPKTSSAKRHKCPYCATDFTRHHNLKSHLLTHSQEKPYVCQTCQARFRRLHDLKRHTKLHTGERPHTCPKCGRRFARGDALARHNKGPEGCAGRRSSIGGDDGEGDDTMDGLEYQEGDDDREDEDMMDDHGRRVSEPSRKRAHHETVRDAERAVYRQHSSTYPPPINRTMRQEVGTMGPPQTILSSSAGASPDLSGTVPSSAGSSYSSQYYPPPPTYAPQHGGITSSPKPISPGNPAPHRLSVGDVGGLRNRSPSLTQQFQHDQFGRGSGRPPPVQHLPSYPPPHLPSLGSLASTHTQPNRMVIQQGPPSAGPSMLHHQQPAPAASMSGSNPSSSISSHGQSSGGSMRDIVGHEPQDMWSYIRNLEQRFSRMQDEYELRISRLQEDLIALKGQVYAPR